MISPTHFEIVILYKYIHKQNCVNKLRSLKSNFDSIAAIYDCRLSVQIICIGADHKYIHVFILKHGSKHVILYQISISQNATVCRGLCFETKHDR